VLLRLQVDGFKNLLGFDASFGPFTCIAGENGVGKSNIFDAVQFLSLIADQKMVEAAQQVRSIGDERGGDPEHLFTAGRPGRTMRFAVEMIVPRSVIDYFGTDVRPSITLLRYEVEIGYERAGASMRHGRLVVEREVLHHINRGDAHRHVRFPHSVRDFRGSVVSGERRGGPFISTDAGQGRINVHQDGVAGRPRRGLPLRAETTVVSTINSADDPTILAARREMQSWRRLALEPSALRAADRYVDDQFLASDGRHLAATLHRIATESGDHRPEDVYARITSRLASLAGLDIRSLRVDADDTRELFTVAVTDKHGREFPARSLSEGTLRYLALCVLLEDPTVTGLITMEEPENGIHPANIPQMVDLVRDLAVDPSMTPGDDNPLRQVVINTHSPEVVQLVSPHDLLVAGTHHVTAGDERLSALRVRGMRGTWRTAGDDPGGATRADLLPYLTDPPGAQITLQLDVA
jgi:predicted ATPase